MAPKLTAKKSFWFKGALAGLVNGLLGSAGGIVVLAFLKGNGNANGEADIDEKQAHATSVCVILPLCIASIVIYIIKGMFDPGISLTLTVGAGVGGILSGLLFKRINSKVLSWIFIGITLVAGVSMLLERSNG